jgi:hypothetical protein
MDSKNNIMTSVSKTEKIKKASDEEVMSSSDNFLRKNKKAYEELANGGQIKSTSEEMLNHI